MNRKLPELLSPAGSFEALKAAIDGGADAVYMGGASFNARINAKNFGEDEMSEAIRLAHAYGVRLYQTVNTMVYDRETDELLRAAESSARAGIDAFIVSDLGIAQLLHSYLPEIELHASTQMSIHNASGARELEKYGFTRVVPARELSHEDICALVQGTSLEVEIFVHGALCVSHSGQCLFSSLVGGRSGNRGLCAQPCRLPYTCDGQRVGDKYPLSLKDLSLAEHIGEIIGSGVASLKIEGRMKSPEYVRGVTSIWRELLDAGKDATQKDMQSLAEIFSRGGFTDSYYNKTVGRGMLGVRSDEDKQASHKVDKFNKITRKIPIDMSVTLREGEAASLALSHKNDSVQVSGAVAQKAINAPIDDDTVKRCLAKLGDTPFSLNRVECKIDGEVMLPISALNSLRRQGVEALMDAIVSRKGIRAGKKALKECKGQPKRRNVGRFFSQEQITDFAKAYFDIITLPLDKYAENSIFANGFVMPTVIFDSEQGTVREMLDKAAKSTPEYVIVSNLGQISLVREYMPRIKMIADFRFNIGNSQTAAFFEELGFESFVASAELTLPQLRDLRGPKAAIVYGRVPLMTLEKCVIRELYGDRRACDICSRGEALMKDRRGFVFPVIREQAHRNIVLNSMPTCMSDRQEALTGAGITDRHFLFYTEKPDKVNKVISAYRDGYALEERVRRI